MKILLTGALGHIATRIVPKLAERFELVLTDLKEGEVAGLPVQPVDIADFEAVQSAMQGVDGVVHLAIASARAIVKDRAAFNQHQGECFQRFNEASIETNVRGTYHLFEAARQNGVQRFVLGSSLTVFLGTPPYERVHDGLPPRPSNFYAVTKLWGENLAEYYSRAFGMTVYCLRFGTPHPWTEHPKYERWVALPQRDWTFVTYDDITRAIEAALGCQSGPQYGAYTVVSDHAENRFDCSKAAEIGWQPLHFVQPDGSLRVLTAAEG